MDLTRQRPGGSGGHCRPEDGAVGRSVWDAPEIDGSVFLNGAEGLHQGDLVQAKVVAADSYDLWAEPITIS